MPKILLIDDEPSILSVLSTLLKAEDYDVQAVLGGENAAELIAGGGFDLMITDIRMSPINGMELLKQAHDQCPGMSVIMLTAYGSVETAIEALKLGAFDYVTKPFKVDELLITVQRAIDYNKAITENADLKAQLNTRYHLKSIVAESKSMQSVCDMIQRVAPTDATILIGGESGTGKELVAKAIHAYSRRKDKNFLAVNCAALPEPLLESEMFGHVKGAFTDAKSDRAGRFEIASGGSLFLDEIGNLSPPLQAKLLTVLQNREIVRLGANKPVPIDVRLICATNMPIAEMVTRQEFRQDLLYRINTVELHLPPLRERPGDIPLLVDHFLGIYGHKYKKLGHQVGRAAMDRLQTHTWPGNVRELQHAVERALIMGEETTLRPEDFLLSGGKVGTEESLAFDEYNLEEVEKQVIELALRKHQGNVSHAARELGLTRTSLYRRMEKYGL